MWDLSPELIVSVGGFTLTFATMLYKFGRLEGQIVERIEGLRERIAILEKRVDRLHGEV